MVDFTSSIHTKVQQNSAFEDESYIVMNKNDLVPNVGILAVEGYGEEEEILTTSKNDDMDVHVNETNINIDFDASGGVLYRGKRAWRDTVGGATVCCNHCCSLLGYASIEEPDTLRLLKHRLCAKESTNKKTVNNDAGNDDDDVDNESLLSKGKDCFAQNTCTSFVGRELVRYAESQAVFTFMIFSDGRKVLMIKLLSWNTSMGYYYRGSSNDRSEDDSENLRRVVKVIFEEIDDIDEVPFQSSDPMNFSWGGFDLCCPPSNDCMSAQKDERSGKNCFKISFGEKKEQKSVCQHIPTSSMASVHLHLPISEYEEIKDILVKGSKLFPEAIARPTIFLKLGKDGESKRGNASLSFLEIPF